MLKTVFMVSFLDIPEKHLMHYSYIYAYRNIVYICVYVY